MIILEFTLTCMDIHSLESYNNVVLYLPHKHHKYHYNYSVHSIETTHLEKDNNQAYNQLLSVLVQKVLAKIIKCLYIQLNLDIVLSLVIDLRTTLSRG